MATREVMSGYLAELVSTPNLPSVSFIVTAVTLLSIYMLQRPKTNVPLLTLKKRFEFSNKRVKQNLIRDAIGVVKQCFATTGNKPFRIVSESGAEITILPANLANEIRNDKRLSFAKNVHRNFFGHLPGFEVFTANGSNMRLLKQIIQRQLTTYLGNVTKPLSDETTLSFREILTDNKEWNKITVKEKVLQIVGRVSSKVFLGDELCHDPRWIDITITYTLVAFGAAEALRLWPAWTRSFVHWFLPKCRQSRAEIKKAREVIEPILKKRAAHKAALAAQGKKPPVINDAIEWLEQASGDGEEKPDPVIVQLGLSLGAIHSTADLVTQVMLDLVEHPEIIEPLRKEIFDTLSEGGWKKTSLYKMKLLDSVIKESQRLKPISTITMARVALENITLSDGTIIPKDVMSAVSSNRMWDPTVYANPDQWDGYRFYNMRHQPGQENVAQFVTTSPDYLVFGHGEHACPGRFFAANEAKVIFCHLLLKYDLKSVEGAYIKPLPVSHALYANPFAPVMIRRRDEGIDIDSLGS
ncbi:P450 monooxygenase [Paracoccidioides lutzii Pb01]|uniref:p450 monooxygenase n=1 Tax=Paracoccidioides lutzii (strain ATCC MYA-826 / Pb01) TaxID=502779 RepID=C1GYX9_PARBA|nr:P450 monooxygenase [Paracoccidioides lutzii Pb01]EEH41802.1 P450 monooxygenase [Paracoccidioides lutzii Pb01]